VALTSTVSNTIKDPNGVVQVGVVVTVTLMPTAGFRVDDSTEVARTVSTTTNGSGVWSIALERNSNITPANTTYEVVEYIPQSAGGPRVWTITVGASNQTVLAALTLSPPSATPSSFLTQASADARYQALGSISSATPAQVSQTTAAAGVDAAASRDDHVHVQPTATPRGRLDYKTAVTIQGSITAEVDLTSLTTTLVIPAGRALKITGKANFQSTVADDRVDLRIYQDGVMINDASTALRVVNSDQTCLAVAFVTPTAASHTYKLTAIRLSGTGTITMACGAAFPAFLLVEDIGV
jgi:hypothetical protein